MTSIIVVTKRRRGKSNAKVARTEKRGKVRALGDNLREAVRQHRTKRTRCVTSPTGVPDTAQR